MPTSSLSKHLKTSAFAMGLFLCFWSVARAGDIDSSGKGDTQVLSTDIVKSKDAKGNVVEKRVVTKLRSRTVVDFEEASIEGKVKKPNAAYLLHGADLDFKHLYHLKNTQRSRILSSYEYLR